jgi:Ohr subfamily peroxiredoxin
MQLRLSRPGVARRPGAWALHEGGRYEPTRKSAVHREGPHHRRAHRHVAQLRRPLEVRLSRPGSPGTGTNPEQLFAAGWSACFDSAMEFAARDMKITLPADHAVDAEIDLGPEGGAFSLAARLYVSLPGMERATAQRLVEAGPPGVSLFASNAREHRRRNDSGLRPLRWEQTEGDRLRPRLWRSRGALSVAGGRCRAAGRIHFFQSVRSDVLATFQPWVRFSASTGARRRERVHLAGCIPSRALSLCRCLPAVKARQLPVQDRAYLQRSPP